MSEVRNSISQGYGKKSNAFIGSYGVTRGKRSGKYYEVKWTSGKLVKVRYTSLTGMDCTCGQSKMKRKPCRHEIVAAKNAFVKIDGRFFGECFSPRKWRSQYERIQNLLPLSDLEYRFKVVDIVKIPFVPKQPRGRPSNHKRHKRKSEIFAAANLKPSKNHAQALTPLSQE